ncbi:MAG: glycosyltransferase family 2 protein [Thermoproteota archaeon]
MNKPFIVACIPAYNEERTIASVIIRTMKHVDKVIVCDDGSTDLTGEIAEKLGVEVIRNERNMGKGVTIINLITHVKKFNPDIVVFLDADGQHNPDEIPRLVEPILKKEADLVIGSRYVKGSQADVPSYRRLGLRIINFVVRKISGKAVRDTQSGFRAYSGKVLELLEACEANGYGVETEQLAIVTKNGLRVMEVPITIRYRGLEKTSKKNPVKHGAEIAGFALRLIIEERPLLFLGVPGVFLIITGIATGVYLIWYFNTTRYFSIPIALITLGSLFVGTILFIASLMLYAISRLSKKLTKNYKKQ